MNEPLLGVIREDFPPRARNMVDDSGGPGRGFTHSPPPSQPRGAGCRRTGAMLLMSVSSASPLKMHREGLPLTGTLRLDGDSGVFHIPWRGLVPSRDYRLIREWKETGIFSHPGDLPDSRRRPDGDGAAL